MTWTLVALAGFALALLLAAAILRHALRSGLEDAPFPFEQCRPLSDREQVLYWRLRKALPEQIVLAQVGMSRMLRVRKGHNFRAWLNRINRMTVDFLICLPDATIVAAIELDDASHGSSERIVADAKKSKALESAGIKLMRFRDIPSESELRKFFLE